jgi:hypothetical protein
MKGKRVFVLLFLRVEGGMFAQPVWFFERESLTYVFNDAAVWREAE